MNALDANLERLRESAERMRFDQCRLELDRTLRDARWLDEVTWNCGKLGEAKLVREIVTLPP